MFTAGVNQQQRLQKDFSDWAVVMLADYRDKNPDQAKFFDMQYAADMATANAASKTNFDWFYIADQDQPAHVWCAAASINSGAGGWAHKNAGWGINSQGQTPGKNFEQNVVKKMFARQINDVYIAHKFGPFGQYYSAASADFMKIWCSFGDMRFYTGTAPSSTGTKTGHAPVFTWGAGYKINGTYTGANWNNVYGYSTIHPNPGAGSTSTPGYVCLSTTDGWSGWVRFGWYFDWNTNNSNWRYTVPTFDIPAMTSLVENVSLYDAWNGWQAGSYRYTAVTYHTKRWPSTTQTAAWGAGSIYNFAGIPVCGHQDGTSPIQLTVPANKVTGNQGIYSQHWGNNVKWYGTPNSYIEMTQVSSALQWDRVLYYGMLAGFTFSCDNNPPHTYTNNFSYGFTGMNSGTDHMGNTVELVTWDHTKQPTYDVSSMPAGDTWPFPWSGSGNVLGPMYSPQFTNNPPAIRLARAVKSEWTWVRDINYLCVDHRGDGPLMFEFTDLFVGLGFGSRYADWWAGAFDYANVYNCIRMMYVKEHTPLLYNVGLHPNFNAMVVGADQSASQGPVGPNATQLNTFFTNGLADRSSMSSAKLYIYNLNGTATCDTSIATNKNWVVDTTTLFNAFTVPVADF